MVKGFILGTSIASLIFFVLWQMSDLLGLNKIGTGILIIITVISWIIILIAVFKDVKKNNNKTSWIAITLFTGWLGGFIYAISVKDNEISKEEAKKERTGNMKNAAIFNYILAGIFLLATLITLQSVSYVSIILLVLSIGFFFLGRYLWKK